MALTVALTSPVGGPPPESWPVRSTHDITYTIAGGTAPYTVKLELSFDNGTTFPLELVTEWPAAAGAGAWPWTLSPNLKATGTPGGATGTAIVKVTVYDDAGASDTDQSAAGFIIEGLPELSRDESKIRVIVGITDEGRSVIIACNDDGSIKTKLDVGDITIGKVVLKDQDTDLSADVVARPDGKNGLAVDVGGLSPATPVPVEVQDLVTIQDVKSGAESGVTAVPAQPAGSVYKNILDQNAASYASFHASGDNMGATFIRVVTLGGYVFFNADDAANWQLGIYDQIAGTVTFNSVAAAATYGYFNLGGLPRTVTGFRLYYNGAGTDQKFYELWMPKSALQFITALPATETVLANAVALLDGNYHNTPLVAVNQDSAKKTLWIQSTLNQIVGIQLMTSRDGVRTFQKQPAGGGHINVDAGSEDPIIAGAIGPPSTITVLGDVAAIYGVPGQKVEITGSHDNDGFYTVLSAVFGGVNTVITLVETLPGAGAVFDGTILCPKLGLITVADYVAYLGAQYLAAGAPTLGHLSIWLESSPS